MNQTQTEEDIFFAALEFKTPDQRTAYLDRACAEDAKLRRRVEALLNRHRESAGPLDAPPPGFIADNAQSIAERPGSIIGPYKLLEQIGEGGMGVVFMAEQTRPIQRKVALKIVKPGMDSKQVLARFDAERQALALMEHANIARVLDAGTTDSGRPYFVMELVRGVPVTDYCDQHRLSIRERLELFVTICQAVQHAHQKGIIHRDLKPTNVLVTQHDGRPLAKVIDFGVAKATGQKLTDKTLFTGFAQLIGTPLYMSPEQAELSEPDVDTRSDIYSLGVLLYELLTGSTPFESQRLKEAAFDELRRIIREEEPPRPSTRISTLAQQAISTVSEKRNSDPRHLSRLFQGELDWIAMKTLDKDRNRRYETASALADDIERYLHDEPVQACPPSRLYRLQKFASRNRVALLTGSVVVATLILGTAVSTWQAIRATRAEQQTKASEQFALKNSRRADAISDFLINAFRSPDPARDGRSVTMAELLDRAVKQVEEEFADDKRMQADLLNAIAQSYHGLGLYRESMLLYGKVQELRSSTQGPRDPGTMEAMGNYAAAYESAGQFDKAIPLYQEVLRIQQERLAADDPELLATTTKLAWAYNMSGQSEKALALFQDVLRLVQAKVKTSGPVPVELPGNEESFEDSAPRKKPVAPLIENTFEHLDDTGSNRQNVLVALNNLAKAFAEAGLVDQAIPLYQQTLKLMQEKLGPDDPSTLTCMYNLAMAFKVAGRYGEAAPIFEEVLRLRREKFGPEDPITVATMTCVGANYGMAGNHDKCVELFGEVLRIRQAKLSDDHPETIWAMWQYGVTLLLADREKEAIPLFEKALAKSRVNPGLDHPTTLGLMSQLTEVYRSNRRFDEAVKLAEQMLKFRQEKWGPDDPGTLGAMNELARLLRYAGQIDEPIRLSRQALELAKAKTPPDHRLTLSMFSALSGRCYFAGRLAEHLAVLQEELEFAKTVLPQNDASVLSISRALGEAFLNAGRYDEGVQTLEATLKITKETIGLNHPDTAESMVKLGEAYSVVGRFDEAIALHEEALRLRELNLGSNHPVTIGTGAAYVLCLKGEYAEAEAVARKSLMKARANLAPDDRRVAGLLTGLAQALLLEGKFIDAEPLARESLEIRIKHPIQPDDWRESSSRGFVGWALLGQRKYAEAEPFLVTAYEELRDREATLPASRKYYLVGVMERLVQLYEATERTKQAAAYRAELAEYKNRLEPRKSTQGAAD